MKPLFWITVDKEREENVTENKEYPVLAISRKENGNGNTYFLTIDNQGFKKWLNKYDCLYAREEERPLFWVYVQEKYAPDYFLPETRIAVVEWEISEKNLFVDLLLVTNSAPLIGEQREKTGKFNWIPFGQCKFAGFDKGIKMTREEIREIREKALSLGFIANFVYEQDFGSWIWKLYKNISTKGKIPKYGEFYKHFKTTEKLLSFLGRIQKQNKEERS